MRIYITFILSCLFFVPALSFATYTYKTVYSGGTCSEGNRFKIVYIPSGYSDSNDTDTQGDTYSEDVAYFDGNMWKSNFWGDHKECFEVYMLTGDDGETYPVWDSPKDAKTNAEIGNLLRAFATQMGWSGNNNCDLIGSWSCRFMPYSVLNSDIDASWAGVLATTGSYHSFIMSSNTYAYSYAHEPSHLGLPIANRYGGICDEYGAYATDSCLGGEKCINVSSSNTNTKWNEYNTEAPYPSANHCDDYNYRPTSDSIMRDINTRSDYNAITLAAMESNWEKRYGTVEADSPSLDCTGIEDGATYSGKVLIECTVTDASSIRGVDFNFSTGPDGLHKSYKYDKVSPYTYEVDLTDFAEGTYYMRVIAWDEHFNRNDDDSDTNPQFTVSHNHISTSDGKIPLKIRNISKVERDNEVIASGIPIPYGWISDTTVLAVKNSTQTVIPAQFKILEAWRNPVKHNFWVGTQTGSLSSTVVNDSTASWSTNELMGHTVVNETDGSICTIASNTSTSFTCIAPLRWGTDNTFAADDAYSIAKYVKYLQVIFIDDITETDPETPATYYLYDDDTNPTPTHSANISDTTCSGNDCYQILNGTGSNTQSIDDDGNNAAWSFILTDESSAEYDLTNATTVSWEIIENGPIRTCLKFETDTEISTSYGDFGLIGWIYGYAGLDRWDVEITLKNTPFTKAGPLIFDDFRVEWNNVSGTNFKIGGSATDTVTGTLDTGDNAYIYQESSGTSKWDWQCEGCSSQPSTCVGKAYGTMVLNWNSLCKNGKPKLKGYSIYDENGTEDSDGESASDQALGWIQLNDSSDYYYASVRDFWQLFPKASEVEEDKIIIRLFPDYWNPYDGKHWLDDTTRATNRITFRKGTSTFGDNEAIAFNYPIILYPGLSYLSNYAQEITGYIQDSETEVTIPDNSLIQMGKVYTEPNWVCLGLNKRDRIRRRYHADTIYKFLRDGDPFRIKRLEWVANNDSNLPSQFIDSYDYPGMSNWWTAINAYTRPFRSQPIEDYGSYGSYFRSKYIAGINNAHHRMYDVIDGWRIIGDPIYLDALRQLAVHHTYFSYWRDSHSTQMIRSDAPLYMLSETYSITGLPKFKDALEHWVNDVIKETAMDKNRGNHTTETKLGAETYLWDDTYLSTFEIAHLGINAKAVWDIFNYDPAMDVVEGTSIWGKNYAYFSDALGSHYKIPVSMDAWDNDYLNAIAISYNNISTACSAVPSPYDNLCRQSGYGSPNLALSANATWSQYDTNIWYTAWDTDYSIFPLWFQITTVSTRDIGVEVSSIAEIDTDYKYIISGSNLYIYASSDPNSQGYYKNIYPSKTASNTSEWALTSLFLEAYELFGADWDESPKKFLDVQTVKQGNLSKAKSHVHEDWLMMRDFWLHEKYTNYGDNLSKYDETSPSAITDLNASKSGTTATLTWTAPDGAVGYVVKYSTLPMKDEITIPDDEGTYANFWSSTNVDNEPTPEGGGALESMELTGLPEGTLYFAVRSFDDENNMSAISNVSLGESTVIAAPR